MARTIPDTLKDSFIETVTISADGSAALPAYFVGRWLVQAHIKTSADDAVTITISKGSSGAIIGTLTTTAATTGEFIPLSASGAENRYITETPYYTLANMASGTATLELVLTRGT